MKKLFGLILILTAIFNFPLLGAAELVVVGNIPGRYIKTTSKKDYQLGYIHIKDRVIQDIGAIKSRTGFTAFKKQFSGKDIIYAKKGAKTYSAKTYDFIYPGLIDLHNHTKQNNLGVWDLAKGQFKNRFEWRAWSKYKYSVSGNMNPWVGYGKPVECAAFRWSELQAMVLGTTFLQGPSSCIKNYAIHQVEDKGSYISNKDKIQAPTDLVIPNDMTFVWDELRPEIKKGASYEKALAKVINRHCTLEGITEASVVQAATIKVLKDKKKLVAACTKGKLHPKFIRYVYWIHGSIAGKKRYLKSAKRAAIIAHLAEGRRDDTYNIAEFEVVKLLGLDQPYVNFVHGVGIDAAGLKHMGKKGMGLIWSPFSNFLLYGQTLDIKAAKAAGIKMSLGSDWLPTGTRGILEEAKVASSYIDKDPEGKKLGNTFTDEEVFMMMTENPAQMINHWEIDIAKKEHGIGRLAVGAMGTIIATKKYVENPYTNLVRKSFAKDMNLVVIDGKPLYANEDYLNQVGITSKSYEVLPMYFKSMNDYLGNKDVPLAEESSLSKITKMSHLEDLGRYVAGISPSRGNDCGFSNKGFVHQNSIAGNKYLEPFKAATGLNLDRLEDLHKLLAINMLTQSRNLNNKKKGNIKYAISKFPSLISCNDDHYMKRVFNFVQADSDSDEFSKNRDPETVTNLREEQSLGRVPESLGKKYAE